jgi:hypothetical protein
MFSVFEVGENFIYHFGSCPLFLFCGCEDIASSNMATLFEVFNVE